MWLAVQKRYRAGVLFLLSNDVEIDPYRPYRQAGDGRTTGTGLLVDARRGLVVTNAHVVAKSKALLARSPALGGRNLNLELVTLCRERDLALCRLEERARRQLESLVEDPVFGDNLL